MDAANVLDSDATETSTTMEQVEQAVNDIAEGATTQAGETQRAEEHVVEMGNMVQEDKRRGGEAACICTGYA